MGNIVLLDELTINQIAAGEVIERPASVVKELIENSIDAGATNITVEIKNGGISYIRITDNGKGIMPDDMEIAFERHATSKIRQAKDLETVKSMGFRGEALASIAAIARVELVSKTESSDIGRKVVVEGGKVISNEEIGCPKGTTITVQNLFFNTPVRYKFLKKDFTEFGYIEDAVTRIALINPNIAIRLINSGKTVIQTSGNNDMKTVIYNIYGKDIAENCLNVDYTYEDIKVTGVVGKPIISRSNRSNQLFFVNKRYVKDKALTSAAEQGFKGMITIGKFGFLILNISVDPHKVDVNVHPAKLEVRFEEESKVFKAIYHSIKETLLKEDLVSEAEKIKNIDITKKTNIQEPKQIYNTEVTKSKDNTTPIFGSLFKKIKNSQMSKEDEEISGVKSNPIEEIFRNRENKEENINEIKNIDENTKTDKENIETIENKEPIKPIENKSDLNNIMEKVHKLEENSMEPDEKNFDEMYAKMFGRLPIEENVQEDNKLNEDAEEYHFDDANTENMSLFTKNNINSIPNYKFIGIAFSTYIIIEMEKELYIIDQHAAHERIMYEKIKKNYYSDGPKESQLMLLPDIITLTHKEMGIAKDNMELFEKAGFTLEEFGENTIKLTGVPNVCIDLETRELFLETLDEINTVARTAKQEIEERFIATVACKAAVKANMALTREEVDELMKELLVLPNPFTCPHGRPTAIRMSKSEIEKKFSRRL
ncbi:MAG TPA: DNA mismatch repair endonuclease MutL [Clostridiaceae bacterium]|nr:DNA mismatch repair endonuclease MutL [Clostridiaceae bacterium]